MNGEWFLVAMNQEVKVARFIGRHCRRQKSERRVIEGNKPVGLEIVLFTHCWCLRHA